VGPDLRHAAYRCAEPVHSLASPPSPSKSTGGHSARAEPARSFTMDGEVVVCRPDGVAMFDALHRRGTITEAVLYAFDLLERDGEDRSADLKRNGLRSAGREDHRLADGVWPSFPAQDPTGSPGARCRPRSSQRAAAVHCGKSTITNPV